MSGYEGYYHFISCINAILAKDLPLMMPLMRQLFPICRSITGSGTRRTLDIIGEIIPLLRKRVPTGTKCFDWEIPREWNISDAYIKNPKGEKIIDFKVNNLHVVNYSIPVRLRLSLTELQEHLHSRPDYPDAIPYLASYYRDYWGFCLTHQQRQELSGGAYEVVIDSTIEPGYLDYAQSHLQGETKGEILFSTNICHPSMANNELSGPVLVTTLMKILGGLPKARYCYRALFVPETIGTITFLSENHRYLREHLEAGYVVSCVGDDGPYTYVRSKRGDTLADKAAEHVLGNLRGDCNVDIRDFNPVGGDERQYCSPGFNLPVGSILRSRHGEFREYHTSKDDLDFVTELGMGSSLEVYLRVIQTLEMNCKPARANPYCEPQLGRRGLYPPLVTSNVPDYQVKLLNILSFADGEHDLIDIANRIRCPVWELSEPLRRLVEADLIRLNL